MANEYKLSYTAEEINQKLGKIDELGESKQSDWNQKDETAPDYIKNRPFYEEVGYGVVLEETEVQLSEMAGDLPPFDLRGGNNYTVTINGIDHEVICKVTEIEGTNANILGNLYPLTENEDDNTGEPFVVLNVAVYGLYAIYYFEESENITVKITGDITNIVQIPYKFVPNADFNIPLGGDGYIKNKPNIKNGEGIFSVIMNHPDNIASGELSYAEGRGTTASESCSHAEGENTTASEYSAHAEGAATTASEYSAHAEGAATTASGNCSHAEGNNTTASGTCSHAEGSNTIASEHSAHAEGYYTTASGDSSHAEGKNTIASGDHSHSEGISTIASGDCSHTEGDHTLASSEYQHVQGKYNREDYKNNYAHIVGNGSSTTRSNAHTLDWDGNAWFQGEVKIGGTDQDDAVAKTLATTEYVDSAVDGLSDEIADIFTSVKKHGAKGDGSNDDTGAIQAALAASRKVYIPAGTYKLTGELVIRDNCELTLAQDAVLDFKQTSGNCISMKMSASIMGHHGTIFVPFGFTGNVINIVTTLNPDTNSLITIPPWSRWDPQWKAGRYIKDLNICKPDTRGFHYAMNPDNPCSGTAIYMSAIKGSAGSNFIWGLNFSGVRIAGAFTYGIRAKNVNEGWNHEMRIEAFLEACETGVSLEDCNNAYLSVVMQPKAGMKSDETKFAYAKCGIELIRCRNTNLYGSRVWDWNANNSLFEYKGRYQHIALIGDCSGTILDDYTYWSMESWDIRELIYTDTPSNLERMVIMQEPFTRWFKVVDGQPCYSDGSEYNSLITRQDLDAHFITDVYPAFTDVMASASDGEGNIFNEIGYMKRGGYINQSTGKFVSSVSYGCTGFIACKPGDVIEIEGISLETEDGYAGLILYTSSFAFKLGISYVNLTSGNSYYVKYEKTEKGCRLTVKDNLDTAGTAYLRISARQEDINAQVVAAKNEEISYTAGGFLADEIRVKKEYVVGLDQTVTAISAASTDQQMPTAKAVYDAIQSSLGVIENGTY